MSQDEVIKDYETLQMLAARAIRRAAMPQRVRDFLAELPSDLHTLSWYELINRLAEAATFLTDLTNEENR